MPTAEEGRCLPVVGGKRRVSGPNCVTPIIDFVAVAKKIAVPERGVPLGNFGAAPIDRDRSVITDGEFMIGETPHPRGADGSIFTSWVFWSKPNAMVEAK